MNRHTTMFVLTGMFYMVTEIVYGAVTAMDPRLVGQTSIWSLVMGGILGLLFAAFSNGSTHSTQRMAYRWRVVIGGLSITLVELASGIILNLWFGFDLSDYRGQGPNLWGQISLYHSVLWIVAAPAFYWVDDVVLHYLSGFTRPSPLYFYYLDLFRGENPQDD